jgi:hypothetical protein
MPDPGYHDPAAWVQKALKKKHVNAENAAAAAVYRATVGFPRRIRNDESMLTCAFINQYSPIKFAAERIEHNMTFMDVVAGLWGFATWRPRHRKELAAILDLAETYPEHPVCLCMRFSSPMDLIGVFYDPDDTIRPAPAMRVVVPDLDGAGVVHLAPLAKVLEVAKTHYRELLPERLAYE